MNHKWEVVLRSDQPIEIEFLIDLNEKLKQDGIEIFLPNGEKFTLQEVQDLLRSKGASYILSIIELREAVLPVVEYDKRPLLVQILVSQLLNLAPRNHLIIIDPYLFPENGNELEYIEIIESIFSAITNDIQKITFITGSKFNKSLVRKTQELLLQMNKSISIRHCTTKIFHDRFWIADESRGMFVGTSLNGLGKRYALTDYMRDEDVRSIVEELRRNALI